MTNPLLQPDDRFRPTTFGSGENPFAEGDAVLDAEAARGTRAENNFAPTAADAGRPFLPQYVVTAEHRGWLLLLIDSVSMLAAGFGLLVVWTGYVLPLLGIIPAVTVINLAADDLRMMRLGGRNPEGRTLTIIALILAAVLAVGLSVMCGLFYFWQFELFPESM